MLSPERVLEIENLLDSLERTARSAAFDARNSGRQGDCLQKLWENMLSAKMWLKEAKKQR